MVGHWTWRGGRGGSEAKRVVVVVYDAEPGRGNFGKRL